MSVPNLRDHQSWYENFSEKPDSLLSLPPSPQKGTMFKGTEQKKTSASVKCLGCGSDRGQHITATCKAPQCGICKRWRHCTDQCYRKPDSPNYKPGLASGQAVTPSALPTPVIGAASVAIGGSVLSAQGVISGPTHVFELRNSAMWLTCHCFPKFMQSCNKSQRKLHETREFWHSKPSKISQF